MLILGKNAFVTMRFVRYHETVGEKAAPSGAEERKDAGE